MLTNIAPWVLSVGAITVFACAAFGLAKAFPKRIDRVRVCVFGAAVAYGLFVLGPVHASGVFGNLYWLFILYGVLCLVAIFFFNRRFGSANSMHDNSE